MLWTIQYASLALSIFCGLKKIVLDDIVCLAGLHTALYTSMDTLDNNIFTLIKFI